MLAFLILLSKTYHIGRLNMIFVFFNALLEIVERDLLVLDHQIDLQLLDTKANRNQLGSTPDQTIHLNGTDVGLELLQVGLVIY